MAGGDEDLSIHLSASGDLVEALRRIEQRLDAVEGGLDSAGRAGERAGDKIQRGADDAAEALARVERAADGAQEDLFGVAKAADKAGDELGDVSKAGERAVMHLTSVERAAEGASEALDDTGKQAKQTARALDDAGDEAAEAGTKAAASATGWNRLWAALDRNERITQRWARTQDTMRWSAWTARADKFKTRMKGLLDLDYDKGAAKLNKLSRAFGGFSRLLTVAKITAVVGAVYALLGALSALGAGAVAATGGIASIAPGLAAILPVAVAGKVAMLAWKAAAEQLKEPLDAIKEKWKGALGTAVAETGGLRKALDYFDTKTVALRENVASGFAIIGQAMSQSVRDVADYASNYKFLQDLGKMWEGLGPIVEQFGKIITRAAHALVNTIRMASPAALQLAKDIGSLLDRFATWTGVMADSGEGAKKISAAYERLKRAVSIVADFLIGLYRIFKIGAQESAWMADSLEAMGVKFKEWTGSVEGQNKIRKYFQDAMPAFKETLLLIKDLVVGLAGLATNQDVAPLINQIRTQLLPAVLELAAKFQGDLLPKLIDFLTRLANLAAGLDFSALTIVLDFLIGIADAMLWVAQNVPGGNAALSVLFTTLLLAGPVAKVLGFLTGSIGKLVSAGKWLATALKGGEGLTFMQKVIGWVGKGVMWLVRLLMGPLVKGIMMVGRILAVAFLGSNPVGWIILGITALVLAFIWAYNNVEWFRNAVDGAFTWLRWAIDYLKAWFDQKLTQMGQAWNYLYATYIAPVIDYIMMRWEYLKLGLMIMKAWFDQKLTQMGQAWDYFYATYIQPIVDRIKGAWDTLNIKLGELAGWFQSKVDMIGQIWNTLRGKLAKPINFLIGTVWNGGILKAWNWVAEKLGLPTGKPMGLIPEYATGGAIRGPGTGTSDSILAAVSNGEHVLTAQEVRAFGGHDSVTRMRQAALAGALPRYATGGPVSVAGDQAAPPTSGGGGLLGWAWSWAKPLISGLIDPVINAIPFRGPPQFMDIPRAMATTGRDRLFEWAERKLNEWGQTSGAGGPLGGGVVAGQVGAMMAALRRVFPGLPLISGFRPGAITATGNPSYHGKGRAVDIPPNMSVFSHIRSVYGANAKELIFSPAGGAQIHNGRPHMYTGVTRRNHFDHIHWAADSGGMLQPGLNTIYNGTNQPEPVFTAGQWSMLDPTNLVPAAISAAMSTPRLEAQTAPNREDELVGAVRALSTALAERPPALSVSGEETRKAVLDALATRDRERAARARYQY